ncbi:hypothetical protein [Blastococcus brunescens]|uniref:WYL domain-containing protein n=1 Tax=Blastococcus brunescens TaxID=1564165 RepID=A0ABZ1B5B9_9ACTN|nr:hypothetical protein [Blastococcus sp. BMG 8361]WRL65552.1 hypothetical protein U6N30_08165 [Blastococcus sp. BMG 8361]
MLREAIERNQLVDLQCIRYTGPDGRLRRVESHHGGLSVAAEERVHGRVIEIQVVEDDGTAQPIHRVPSGQALRGYDGDDGHLEAPGPVTSWHRTAWSSSSPFGRRGSRHRPLREPPFGLAQADSCFAWQVSRSGPLRDTFPDS